jgi:hypothetical protein
MDRSELHRLKKATQPLDPHLRAGGYEVFPIVEVHQLGSNVWSLAMLTEKALLPEPLASWATNAFYSLGFLKGPRNRRVDLARGVCYGPVRTRSGENTAAEIRRKTFLTPDHFIPRLTQTQAQRIIGRVIRNAERINDEWSRFYYEWIGIFGSVLNCSKSPADVNIVYSVRSSKDGNPLRESSYHPLSRSGLDDIAARALSTGCRRSAVSPHNVVELESLGIPYQIIWTEAKGRVNRKIILPISKKAQKDTSKRDLARSNAFAADVRARCAALPPLPLPENPFIPLGTKALSLGEWTEILSTVHPVVHLAHALCLPPGVLKEKVSKLVNERFAVIQEDKIKAERLLYPYLAASALYATRWRWDSTIGLRKAKRGGDPQRLDILE